jgi:hypothetical protein
VSVLAGSGSVWLTYLLALRISRCVLPTARAHWSAMLAAGLIGLGGLNVQASATIMADAPALSHRRRVLSGYNERLAAIGEPQPPVSCLVPATTREAARP